MCCLLSWLLSPCCPQSTIDCHWRTAWAPQLFCRPFLSLKALVETDLSLSDVWPLDHMICKSYNSWSVCLFFDAKLELMDRLVDNNRFSIAFDSALIAIPMKHCFQSFALIKDLILTDCLLPIDWQFGRRHQWGTDNSQWRRWYTLSGLRWLLLIASLFLRCGHRLKWRELWVHLKWSTSVSTATKYRQKWVEANRFLICCLLFDSLRVKQRFSSLPVENREQSVLRQPIRLTELSLTSGSVTYRVVTVDDSSHPTHTGS